jgi:hypothetical protein
MSERRFGGGNAHDRRKQRRKAEAGRRILADRLREEQETRRLSLDKTARKVAP